MKDIKIKDLFAKPVGAVKVVTSVVGAKVGSEVNYRLSLHEGKKIVKQEVASMGAEQRAIEAAKNAAIKAQRDQIKAQEAAARKLIKEQEDAAKAEEALAAAKAKFEAAQAQFVEATTS